MRYFVSYSHRRGFGHAEVPFEGLIKGIEDIRTIAKEIEKEIKVKDVIILNFIPLEPLDPIAIGEIKLGDIRVIPVNSGNGALTTGTVTLNNPGNITITGAAETNKEPSTKIIK